MLGPRDLHRDLVGQVGNRGRAMVNANATFWSTEPLGGNGTAVDRDRDVGRFSKQRGKKYLVLEDVGRPKFELELASRVDRGTSGIQTTHTTQQIRHKPETPYSRTELGLLIRHREIAHLNPLYGPNRRGGCDRNWYWLRCHLDTGRPSHRCDLIWESVAGRTNCNLPSS